NISRCLCHEGKLHGREFRDIEAAPLGIAPPAPCAARLTRTRGEPTLAAVAAPGLVICQGGPQDRQGTFHAEHAAPPGEPAVAAHAARTTGLAIGDGRGISPVAPIAAGGPVATDVAKGDAHRGSQVVETTPLGEAARGAVAARCTAAAAVGAPAAIAAE